MPSYFDYLDIARSAEDDSATATQKLQQGLLALLQAYTSRTYLFWVVREFSEEFVPLAANPPINIATLISTLATLCVTHTRRANGDLEQLVSAVYFYIKQKNLDEINVSALDEIQVSIIIGRDWNLLSTKLSDLVDPANDHRLPRKKYEFYRLHARSLSAISSPYHQAVAVLNAYARPWLWRSHQRQINTLLRQHTELGGLCHALVSWINSPEFSGFTTDGDFEHAMAGLYLVLGVEAQIFADIRITLAGSEARPLKEHFPATPISNLAPPSPTHMGRGVSQASTTTTPTTVNTTIISPTAGTRAEQDFTAGLPPTRDSDSAVPSPMIGAPAPGPGAI